MMTLAQGHYCTIKNYDPMDPRCARVVLTGKIRAVGFCCINCKIIYCFKIIAYFQILEDNPEIAQAKNAVFGRHPWLAHMPEGIHVKIVR